MSQDENELPPPTKKTSSVGITPKTSAVPLKKETVRITLRANAPGVDAPSATVPLAPRPGPPAPSAPLGPPPRPSAGPPAPSAPTAPGAPPRPAPPVAPAGSKTIPLAAPPPRATSPALARPVSAPQNPSASVPAGAIVTQALPRTPARLPSASPTAAVSSAPIRSVSLSDDDAEVDDGPLNIMALIALVASLAMLFFAFASVDAWPLSEGVAVTQAQKEQWDKNEVPSSFKLPMDYSPFDKKVGESVKSEYDAKAPVIPERPSADGQ